MGPQGAALARAPVGDELVLATLDRADPDLQVALTTARPWRASATAGDIYRDRLVTDRRSAERQIL